VAYEMSVYRNWFPRTSFQVPEFEPCSVHPTPSEYISLLCRTCSRLDVYCKVPNALTACNVTSAVTKLYQTSNFCPPPSPTITVVLLGSAPQKIHNDKIRQLQTQTNAKQILIFCIKHETKSWMLDCAFFRGAWTTGCPQPTRYEPRPCPYFHLNMHSGTLNRPNMDSSYFTVDHRVYRDWAPYRYCDIDAPAEDVQ
jgi:hypothetical protein